MLVLKTLHDFFALWDTNGEAFMKGLLSVRHVLRVSSIFEGGLTAGRIKSRTIEASELICRLRHPSNLGPDEASYLRDASGESSTFRFIRCNY